MCAMALMHARVRRVVWGAPDPKTGAAGSVVNLFDDVRLNHHTEVLGGVLAEACGTVLRDFFAERRVQQRAERAVANAEGGEDGGAAAAGMVDPGVAADEGLIPVAEVLAGEPGGSSADEVAAPIPAGEAVELPPEEAGRRR
jgi:tRNA(adenine34) deaminase